MQVKSTDKQIANNWTYSLYSVTIKQKRNDNFSKTELLPSKCVKEAHVNC